MDVTTKSNNGKQKQQSRKQESIKKKEWMEEATVEKTHYLHF